MNIRNIFKMVLTGSILSACTPDDVMVFENPVEVEDIKIIRLTSDHNMLLPDGKAEMVFRCMVYGIRDLKHLKMGDSGENVSYSEEMQRDTFLIPDDQLPEGFVKVYDDQGKEVVGNVFKTTDTLLDQVVFQAKGGEIVSEPLTIKIRELPETYEELVIPVMFHILIPQATDRPTYSVDQEKLEQTIQRWNDIFNNRVSTNPNGGNARITFKLALYNENGNLLEYPGREEIKLEEELDQQGYIDFVNNGHVWDPSRYLNIYIANYSKTFSGSGRGSGIYIAPAPKVIMEGMEAIPGIEAKVVSSFGLEDIMTFSDVAIMLNYNGFLNPSSLNRDNAMDLSVPVAAFLGLEFMAYSEYYDYGVGDYVGNLVDGDTDYCADTKVYDSAYGIYKTDYFNEKEYFTTFNIMADYSRNNSITVDQARRIRMVLERCPSRWFYKSSWAFNGKHD